MSKLIGVMFEDDRGTVCVGCIDPAEDKDHENEEAATPIHEGAFYPGWCERCGNELGSAE